MEAEKTDGEIRGERGEFGCIPALSLVSGEEAWHKQGRQAALEPVQATHCATLPRKSPGQRRTGRAPKPGPPETLQRAPGGPLCPELNHLTHLVPSVW